MYYLSAMIKSDSQIFISYSIAFLLLFLLSACGTQPNSENKPPITESANPLTADQQAAFDALNTIQVNAGGMNLLYSTFPNITQPCYPPDTSFVISQSQLMDAVTLFVRDNCASLSDADRDALPKIAVLAQSEYKVLHCRDTTTNITFENNLPMYGTWVMPGVLDRRDVIIKW